MRGCDASNRDPSHSAGQVSGGQVPAGTRSATFSFWAAGIYILVCPRSFYPVTSRPRTFLVQPRLSLVTPDSLLNIFFFIIITVFLPRPSLPSIISGTTQAWGLLRSHHTRIVLTPSPNHKQHQQATHLSAWHELLRPSFFFGHHTSTTTRSGGLV